MVMCSSFPNAWISNKESATGLSTSPPTLSLNSRNFPADSCFQSARPGFLPLGQKYGEICSFVYRWLGDALDRAARQRRELRGVSARIGEGIRHCNAKP